MSSGQWRVLFIVLAIITIEALFSDGFNGIVSAVTSTDISKAIDFKQPIADQLASPAMAIISYSVALVVLLLLADVAPDIATWIAVISLTLVIFRHSDKILPFVTNSTTGLLTLGGH